MYITQRLENLISSNAVTNLGASPAQVSGGFSALTAVSPTYIPSRARQCLRITNTHPTNNLFIGSTSATTNANGGGWFKKLAPGEYFDDLANGSVPRYLVASAANTTATIEEYQ